MLTGGVGWVSLFQNDHLEIVSGRTQRGGLSQDPVTSLQEYGDENQWMHCCRGLSALCAGDLVLLVFVRYAALGFTYLCQAGSKHLRRKRKA